MAYIASIGLGIPEENITQEEVKQLVQKLFQNHRRLQKLLPVYDNAMVSHRQLAKEKVWYETKRSFAEKNAAYIEEARKLSLRAIDDCLEKSGVHYSAIDAIVFVSSSGIATPSLDAHLINERDFREDVIRMPLWGLGCAGGAIALSRGFEWLQAHKQQTALVVACELCSLTFQQEDDSMSNLVGTALFGDGAAAVLLHGEKTVNHMHLPENGLVLRQTSSKIQKQSLDVMGWKVAEGGLEVVFSKNIPKLVPGFWKEHVTAFLDQHRLSVTQLSKVLAHPGGRKVLEAMENSMAITKDQLTYAYQVLKDHGNMSAVTVLYVLKKWLDEKSHRNVATEFALICALGPGFSSEILLVERNHK